MTHVWFESFYDPGKPDRVQEDNTILAYPFFGVIDAYSEPHGPSHPQKMFYGRLKTGGQLVCNAIKKSIENFACQDSSSIADAIKLASNEIYSYKRVAGLWPHENDFWSGASFLIGKISQNSGIVEIAQGGNCTAIVVLKSHFMRGEIEVIWGEKFHLVEMERRRKIAEILARPDVEDDRRKMWDIFYPKFCESIKEKGNAVYPILDGRTQLLMEILETKKFPLNKLKMIVCFTDSMMPWKENPEWQTRKRTIVEKFQQTNNGFRIMLDATRALEDKHKRKSHETHAEVSCQVIHFE